MENILIAQSHYSEMQRELQAIQATDTDPSIRNAMKSPVVSRIFNPLNRLIIAGVLSVSVGSALVHQVEAGGDDTGNRNPNHERNEKNDRNSKEERKHNRKNNNGNSNGNDNEDQREVCAQALTIGYNPITGETREFPTRCLPEGWVSTSKQRTEPTKYCAQKLTGAYNPQTGQTTTFPTTCLPSGWFPLNSTR